jgi:Zn finger protein HypA/HybF involved in hydrogenase expression
MSLALEICRLTQDRVGCDHLADVVTVALDVGDDAGVEIGNLEFCLEVLLSHEPFGQAHPIINRRPGDVFQVTYLELDDGNPDD